MSCFLARFRIAWHFVRVCAYFGMLSFSFVNARNSIWSCVFCKSNRHNVASTAPTESEAAAAAPVASLCAFGFIYQLHWLPDLLHFVLPARAVAKHVAYLHIQIYTTVHGRMCVRSELYSNSLAIVASLSFLKCI